MSKFINSVIGSFATGNPIGGLISAAGSIFGGLFGKKGQEEANATNLQIARETNEANRANQEYQNEWNLDMWNKQNEYNSPLAQRQRLESAGLNPVFFGLDGTGNAGSLQSAPFTAQTGAPMLNSGQFMGAGIMNAMNSFADYQLKMSQANKNESDAELTQLENQIKKATAGDVIASAHWNMKILKGTFEDLMPAQVKELNAKAEQFSAVIQNMADTLQFAKDQFEFTKLQTDIENFFESLRIGQAQAKLLQDGLFGLIHAIQNGQRIAIEGNVANANIELIGEYKRRAKYDNDFNEQTMPIFEADGKTPTNIIKNIRTSNAWHSNASAWQEKTNAFNSRDVYYIREEWVEAWKANMDRAEDEQATSHYIGEMTRKANHRYWQNDVEFWTNFGTKVADTATSIYSVGKSGGRGYMVPTHSSNFSTW